MSPPVFDVHAHIVPPSLFPRMAGTPFAAGQTRAGWVVNVPGQGDTRPIRPAMTDPGARRDWLARTGVARQLLAPWMDIQAADLPAAAGRDWAARLNEAMAETARDAGSPALASLDLRDGDTAAADLEKVAAWPEIAGLLLSTNPVNGPELHDPRLDPLWSVAAERSIPIMLHPPTCGPSGALPSIDGMGNVYGRLVDNTLAVTQLILHGVLDRYPRLKLLLVHGGGFLPFQAARLDGGYRVRESFVAPLERESPSAYLADLYYDTAALSGAAIAFLAGLVGADRVLLGSDYPFALGDPEPVRTVRGALLPDADTDAILGGNAARLFP
jgi:aminocarboxymuconate-semialdehyde decarboxylase